MTQTAAPIHDDKAALRALKAKPLIAWPTILLLATAQSFIIGSWVLYFQGIMPLWIGVITNTIAYYMLFTPAHDTMHKSVSSKGWVNDLVLYLTMFTVVPGSSGKLLGLMHMQHHRFTGEELDPDHAVVANKWNVLFTWFFWDFRYLFVYLKNREHYPPFSSVKLWSETIIGLGIIAAIATVYPLEVLMLWLIPTRLMGWLICAVFMYLPHNPHLLTDKQAPYQATLIREGWEWLITPLMMYQNFHLVHHLYPTVPFYRYKKAWFAREEFHNSHNPAKADTFALLPRNYEEIKKIAQQQ